jgi:phage gpG-like protein
MARMFSDIGSFVRFVETVAIAAGDDGKEQALETMAKAIKAKARGVLGTYEYPEWPQLADATQEERARLGYPANEPLLRDGTLRESIDYTIIKPGELAEVGSNLDIAVFQELGTERIPARSFLALTGAKYGEAAAEAAGAIVAAAIADKRVLGGELRELFHILHKLGHELKEDAKELLDSADEKDEQQK